MNSKPSIKKNTKNSSSTPKKKVKKKAKNRRESTEYPALQKQYSLKTRGDLVDYDYLDKLSPSEKQWLNDFTNEEIHAAVNKEGRKNRFNKKRKDIKEIYHKNNARNRCTWTREKAKGMAQYLEEHKENLLSSNPEDYIIVKMELEEAGWVDSEGNVLITEKELEKLLEKKK